MKLKTITRYRQEGDNYYVYLELFMSNKGGAIYMDVPIINSMLKHFDIIKSEFAEFDGVEGIVLTIIPDAPEQTKCGEWVYDSADLLHDFQIAYYSFLRKYNTKNKPFPFIMQKPQVICYEKNNA